MQRGKGDLGNGRSPTLLLVAIHLVICITLASPRFAVANVVGISLRKIDKHIVREVVPDSDDGKSQLPQRPGQLLTAIVIHA